MKWSFPPLTEHRSTDGFSKFFNICRFNNSIITTEKRNSHNISDSISFPATGSLTNKMNVNLLTYKITV